MRLPRKVNLSKVLSVGLLAVSILHVLQVLKDRGADPQAGLNTRATASEKTVCGTMNDVLLLLQQGEVVDPIVPRLAAVETSNSSSHGSIHSS